MRHYFLDTNVVLDFLARREPFAREALQLFRAGLEQRIRLYVASLSFSTVYYLLRKASNRQQARELVRQLAQLVTVVAVDAQVVRQAIAGPISDSDYAQAEKLIDDVVADFGKLDILVNNAGITQDGLLMRMSEQQWDQVLQVNLKSVFNLTKAATKPMMRAKTGSIINMTSVVGLKGNAGQANYAASKAGIIGFTKSVALELGSRNIRCNAIAPGFIETEMTGALDQKQVDEWRKAIPLKRGGSPEDVAKATAFLASDASSYITGQVLQVDGGMLT